tara:strand:- start:138 stop:341 length:204 start_codon:yes stop_codon:yes gene_type:complete
MKARIENHNTLVRDLNNNAILNVDTVSINKAKLSKKLRKSQKQEIEDIKSDVTELKSMMREILDRLR